MKVGGQVAGQGPWSPWQLYFAHSNLSSPESETSGIVLMVKPRE